MPTTRPRKISIGGVELSFAVERTLAERIKANPIYRALRRTPPPVRFRDNAPDIDGLGLDDIRWYHTIELGNGVVTPGLVDHRDQVVQYGFPNSLAGKRCLDVATYDGFWAFEMEKRGAAEVVGIDIYSAADFDVPRNWAEEIRKIRPNDIKGYGFAYARRALRSNVKRKVLNVYELSPDKVGTFDFVFVSDLLLHLREPLRALEALWSVTRGEIIIADVYDTELESCGHQGSVRFMVNPDDYSGYFWWWPTTSALRDMIRLARFQEVERIDDLVLDTSVGIKVPKVIFRAKGGK